MLILIAVYFLQQAYPVLAGVLAVPPGRSSPPLSWFSRTAAFRGYRKRLAARCLDSSFVACYRDYYRL
jgi:hypothetical protein